SEEEQRDLAGPQLRQEANGRWIWKIDPAIGRQRATGGSPPRPDLWPGLATLPCPTLVVWGTDSDVLSEGQARKMIEVLPKAELVAVPGVGHAPDLGEPASREALERFLPGKR